MNSTRKQGLVLLFAGGAGAALISVAGVILASHGWEIHLHGYGIGIPGAVALVGVIQLVSGVPFSELAQKWDSLAGWQRGVLGVLIVAVATVIIFAVMILIAQVLYS